MSASSTKRLAVAVGEGSAAVRSIRESSDTLMSEGALLAAADQRTTVEIA